MTLNETGLRPVTWLDQLGILDEHAQIVHAVWVDDLEIDLLRDRNALVVHCPVSNAVLGSGIAPIGKMLKRGVRLRLGTDGSASNDTQDCLENTKMAICLARAAHQDAANVTNEQALRMALSDRSIYGRSGRRFDHGQPEYLAISPGARYNFCSDVVRSFRGCGYSDGSWRNSDAEWKTDHHR